MQSKNKLVLNWQASIKLTSGQANGVLLSLALQVMHLLNFNILVVTIILLDANIDIVIIVLILIVAIILIVHHASCEHDHCRPDHQLW